MSQLTKLEIKRLQNIEKAAQDLLDTIDYSVFTLSTFLKGSIDQIRKALEPVFDWDNVEPGTPVKQLTETGIFLRIEGDDSLLIFCNDEVTLWPMSRCWPVVPIGNIFKSAVQCGHTETQLELFKTLQITSTAIREISPWLSASLNSDSKHKNSIEYQDACDAVFQADKLLNPAPSTAGSSYNVNGQVCTAEQLINAGWTASQIAELKPHVIKDD